MKTTDIKKNKGFLSLFILIWIIVYPFHSYCNPDDSFNKLKSSNGIDLYYRWMKMPDGNKVRQLKAVLDVQGGSEEVITLLRDEAHAMEWIRSAQQYSILTSTSGSAWINYIRFSVPWPLADQDCILEYNIEETSSGETWIHFKCVPEYLELVDGVSRMKEICGSIVVKSLSDQHSRLECYFLSKKASVIPRWLTEPIITGSILNVLEGMRNQLAEQKV